MQDSLFDGILPRKVAFTSMIIKSIWLQHPNPPFERVYYYNSVVSDAEVSHALSRQGLRKQAVQFGLLSPGGMDEKKHDINHQVCK